MIRTACLVVTLGVLAGSNAAAQPWAVAMFRNNTSHDFGIVPRGSKVEYRFTLENLYVEDVHIASVETSCHCTSPSFEKALLKTYEKADIVVSIDTRTFQGRKDATLRVTFDKPFPAVVELHSYCYIRSDVVCDPGQISYGSVYRGAGAQRMVTVSYAGRSDWKIVDVESTYPHLRAKVQEVSRAFGQVVYRLWVDLKPDAPVGHVRDNIFLVTNDLNAEAARVPISVEALILAPLSAQPAMISLGPVRAGESVVKNVIVQSQTPFQITSFTPPDGRFSATLPREAKAIQVLPIRFAAGTKPGKVEGRLVIKTDAFGGQSVEVPVTGEVIAPAELEPVEKSAPPSTDSPAATPPPQTPAEPAAVEPKPTEAMPADGEGWKASKEKKE